MSQPQPFTPQWQEWVDLNLARKCEPQGIVDILKQNHFPLDIIQKAMGEHFPEPVSRDPYRGADYAALTRPRMVRLEGKEGIRRFDTPDLQLYTIDPFMSEEECDTLVAVIRKHPLKPSGISHDNGDKYFRTSSTSEMSMMNEAYVDYIDNKIAHTLGINPSYSEGIQAQRYEVGQQFKPHSDYFEPYSDEYERFARAMGNRTWSFMVYLNDTPKGGGTQFTHIDHIFYPKKGMAVVWNNLLADGTANPRTMHSGMPVQEGEKIVITKWFREKGMGKMFVD